VDETFKIIQRRIKFQFATFFFEGFAHIYVTVLYVNNKLILKRKRKKTRAYFWIYFAFIA
jgi:hypothetical protein